MQVCSACVVRHMLRWPSAAPPLFAHASPADAILVTLRLLNWRPATQAATGRSSVLKSAAEVFASQPASSPGDEGSHEGVCRHAGAGRVAAVGARWLDRRSFATCLLQPENSVCYPNLLCYARSWAG